MQLTAWHKHKWLNYIAKMAIVYGIMLPGYLMQHEWLLTEVSVSVERVSCYVRACDSSGQNCSSIPHFPLLVGHTTKHVEELLVISLEVQMPFHSCTWAKTWMVSTSYMEHNITGTISEAIYACCWCDWKRLQLRINKITARALMNQMETDHTVNQATQLMDTGPTI